MNIKREEEEEENSLEYSQRFGLDGVKISQYIFFEKNI